MKKTATEKLKIVCNQYSTVNKAELSLKELYETLLKSESIIMDYFMSQEDFLKIKEALDIITHSSECLWDKINRISANADKNKKNQIYNMLNHIPYTLK